MCNRRWSFPIFRSKFRYDWGLWKIIWWLVCDQNLLTWEYESGSVVLCNLKSLPLRKFSTFRDSSPAVWATHSHPWLPFAISGEVFTLNIAPQFFLSSFTVKPASCYFRGEQDPNEILQSICLECPRLDNLCCLWFCMQTQRFAGKNFSGGIIFWEGVPLYLSRVSELQDHLSKTFFTCSRFSSVSCDKWQCRPLLEFIVEKKDMSQHVVIIINKLSSNPNCQISMPGSKIRYDSYHSLIFAVLSYLYKNSTCACSPCFSLGPEGQQTGTHWCWVSRDLLCWHSRALRW